MSSLPNLSRDDKFIIGMAFVLLIFAGIWYVYGRDPKPTTTNVSFNNEGFAGCAAQARENFDTQSPIEQHEDFENQQYEQYDQHEQHEQHEGFAGCAAPAREGFAGCAAPAREGFAGCAAPAREGFSDPLPAEDQQDSSPKLVGGDNTLGMNQMPSECYPKDVLSSVDLLPSDANSHYAMVNPNGQGALSDKNFLTAGYHIGINTIGQTLRNANRQLRSDPPCPQVSVSPWNNTTIEYDGNRRPLEIGGV